mgnify:CR=1 FL=1
MSVIIFVLQIILGVALLIVGIGKLTGVRMYVNAFRRWRLQQSFRIVVGGLEVFASLLIFAGMFSDLFLTFGALISVGISIGGILVHLSVKDRMQEMLPIILIGSVAFILLLVGGIG